jgi:predicted TPR repeat methyltransferase
MAEVKLPQLGETVTEGTITKWFKKVGDAVAADEPLFEVSTDKVDTEVPSPVSGVLTEVRAKEGDTVLDPFACTGTFLLAASKLGRLSRGCDISQDHIDIAVQRGCVQ